MRWSPRSRICPRRGETWYHPRDVLGRDAAEVSERLGLTSRQQRAILNRARARLRERADHRLVEDGEE